jgi:ribosome-binding protein aMBF1 (putative translation factor)
MAKSFQAYKTKALKNKAVLAEYEALAPEFAVIQSIIRQRIKRGWSQADLAEAIGTRQPVISRLERGEGNPSLRTLKRIAEALELSLTVTLK